MSVRLYSRLSLMMFLQWFIMGAWYVTVGNYMAKIGLDNFHTLGRLLSGLAHVRRVELLRYHRLAESKYARMGSDYSLKGLASPPEALAESRRAMLAGYGLPNVIWR